MAVAAGTPELVDALICDAPMLPDDALLASDNDASCGGSDADELLRRRERYTWRWSCVLTYFQRSGLSLRWRAMNFSLASSVSATSSSV